MNDFDSPLGQAYARQLYSGLMQMPRLGCPCGKWQALSVTEDTGEYNGWIWQAVCTCGRSWTVEVADDPTHGRPDSVGGKKTKAGKKPGKSEKLPRALELIEQLRDADFIPEEFEEEVEAILSK